MATKMESLEWDGDKQVVRESEVDTVGLRALVAKGKHCTDNPSFSFENE